MLLNSLVLEPLPVYPREYVDAIRRGLEVATNEGQLICDVFPQLTSLEKNVFLATTRYGVQVAVKYLLSDSDRSSYPIVNSLPPIPGIIRYYGIYNADVSFKRKTPAFVRSDRRIPFLFMEYVPGEHWDRLPTEFRELALFQLVGTLSLLRKSSFIYDDLALRNIIIRRLPEPQVLQYGDYQVVSDIIPTLVDLGTGRGSFGNWQQYLQDFINVSPNVSDDELLRDLASRIPSRFPIFLGGASLNPSPMVGHISYERYGETHLLPFVANTNDTPRMILDKLISFERRLYLVRNDRQAWERLDAEFMAHISNPEVIAGDVENRIPFLLEDLEEIRDEK